MQEDRDRYSFINEKIKEKPINKKRLLIYAGYAAAVAVMCGVIVSLVFAWLAPEFARMLHPEENPTVTIPKDDVAETETEEPTEAIANGTEDLQGTEQGTEAVSGTENSQGTENPQGEEDPPGKADGTEGAAGGEDTALLPREFTIEDFQKLQNELYAVGREANRFVVTVTGVKSDTDWFNNPYESRGQASGIIVADNGQELLILSERKVIADVEEVYVTFVNETSVAATMKKYDGNTGIAILAVPLESVDEETMQAVAVATLGNSLLTTQGMIAIAVGSPLGTNYSILTGNITSTTNSISTVDSNYTVFTTDIVGSKGGSGAIINVKGEVIGLVMQDYGSSGDENTLTAISISELKKIIEMLSNNQDIPYIGLDLITVTNDIANEYELPKGAYIREVKMDSPAMAGGLQSGDIITKVDGETIYNVDAFEHKLLTLVPGQSVKIAVERQSAEGYSEITCTVEVQVLQ